MTGTAMVMPQTLATAAAAKPKPSGAADPAAELRLLPEFSGLFAALESGQRTTPEPGSEAGTKDEAGAPPTAATSSPLDLFAGLVPSSALASQPSSGQPAADIETDAPTPSPEAVVAPAGVQPPPVNLLPPEPAGAAADDPIARQSAAAGAPAAMESPSSPPVGDAALSAMASPASANVVAANAGAATAKAETPGQKSAPVEPLRVPVPEPTAPMGDNGASGEGDQAGDGQNKDGAEFVAAFKDAKVTVVRQETHFAPVAGLSPAHQLASQILKDIDASAVPEGQSAASAADGSKAGASLKTLQIQLDPPELGLLTVRMSLKDDVLHLQIQATRHETAKMIQSDQEAISKLLRSAGYAVEGMTIQVTAGERVNPAAAAYAGAGSFGQSSGQQSAWRNEERGEGRRLRHASAAERIAETIHATEPAGGVGPHRRGLVYL